MNNYKKLLGAVSGLTLFSATLVTGPAVATTFDFQLNGGFAPAFSLPCAVKSFGGNTDCLEYDMDDSGTGPHLPHSPFEGSPNSVTTAIPFPSIPLPPPLSPGFSAIPAGTYDAYQGMQWDRTPVLPLDSRRSRLEITMPGGAISDNGPGGGPGASVDGSKITHFNRTLLSADDTLTGGVILEGLTLFDEGHAGDDAHKVVELPTIPFWFLFDETLDVGPCPAFQESLTPCDDRFLLLNPQQDLEIMFTVDSIDYWLTINVVDLEVIDDPDFGTVGQLVTTEASDNEFKVVLTLEQHGQIPEPMALAMLGMGLLGFGAWRRRSEKI